MSEPQPTPILQGLIEKGVELDRREGDLKWEWGDLMLEVAPGTGRGGALREAGTTIPELIEKYVAQLREVGVEREVRTLIDYRDTAGAWANTVRTGFAWTVGYHLRTQADRVELVQGYRFTVAQARELVSIRTTVKTDCTLDDFKDFLTARAANPTLTAAEFFAIVESEKAAELLTALYPLQELEVVAGSLDDMNATQERWLRTYLETAKRLIAAIELELPARKEK